MHTDGMDVDLTFGAQIRYVLPALADSGASGTTVRRGN